MATDLNLGEWCGGVFLRLRRGQYGMRLTAMTGTDAIWPLLLFKPAAIVPLLGLALPTLYLDTRFVWGRGLGLDLLAVHALFAAVGLPWPATRPFAARPQSNAILMWGSGITSMVTGWILGEWRSGMGPRR
jgi:hypothetical protein